MNRFHFTAHAVERFIDRLRSDLTPNRAREVLDERDGK
jgi:hypothetical protein